MHRTRGKHFRGYSVWWKKSTMSNTKPDRYTKGPRQVTATRADGTDAVLIRGTDTFFLRVYSDNGQFTDYDIHHDDLSVRIADDALASFYSDGERRYIDHSPEVLGLVRKQGG